MTILYFAMVVIFYANGDIKHDTYKIVTNDYNECVTNAYLLQGYWETREDVQYVIPMCPEIEDTRSL